MNEEGMKILADLIRETLITNVDEPVGDQKQWNIVDGLMAIASSIDALAEEVSQIGPIEIYVHGHVDGDEENPPRRRSH